MNRQEYIDKYYAFAKQAERATGVPALFALAQSALESGWGKSMPGNMMFGMKTGAGKNFGGWQGDKQLITTTEFADHPNLKFPQILPGYPKKEGNKWRYIVKDYFRAYPTPLHTFLDWAGMLANAGRYGKAMQHRQDPFRFAEEVAKGGYATDPDYVGKIKVIMVDLLPILENKESASRTLKLIIIILVVAGTFAAGYGIARLQKNKIKQ